MDAFFASIEQRDDPSLKGKPVIVGALPGNRGVVAAASYEARKFGIHSAMPINQAYTRCPHGVFLRPRMQVYAAVSQQVCTILESYSPQIEQVSIDEAFMDMTGTRKLWGPPLKAARSLAQAIKSSLCLTASIGIAPNRFCAKIASDLNKPDGITEVPFAPEEIIRWLAPMDVSRIWGVGKKTSMYLNSLGIRLIGDLQQLSTEQLERRFGKSGLGLYDLCRGVDSREVAQQEKMKSISREHTFNTDSYDKQEWSRTIMTLARDVAQRTRREGLKGRTIFLTFRTPDFQRHTRQTTLSRSTNLAKHIFEHTQTLLSREFPRIKGIRLIGVGICNFEEELQTDLFGNPPEVEAWNASETAMDRIAERFGENAIRGREVKATRMANASRPVLTASSPRSVS
jgi:DNA polymerase-4